MDPLTHTLVGASLSATRLGTKTRRAGAALVVGANLPDVDALAYFAGGDAALGFRRGWTHGVPALLLLPIVLALILWLTPSRAAPRGEGRALSLSWLLGLSYLAVFSHPFLDWLNTYGMRWWMPFSDTWYYGDAVFIMDPWLWLVLGAGWLAGRRRRPGWIAVWALVAASLLWVAWNRVPSHAWIVATVALVLLAALVRQPRESSTVDGATSPGARPAMIGLLLAALYVAAMISLHAATVRQVGRELTRAGVTPVDQLMVGPLPANPLGWELVARSGDRIHTGRFSWLGGDRLELADDVFHAADSFDAWDEILASGQARGFLGWARFPWLEESGTGQFHLMDARYVRRRSTGFGAAEVQLPGE